VLLLVRAWCASLRHARATVVPRETSLNAA
jgi:hypothetical protein